MHHKLYDIVITFYPLFTLGSSRLREPKSVPVTELNKPIKHSLYLIASSHLGGVSQADQ